MSNTQRIHLSPHSVPRRVQHPQQVTTLRSVRQDNPTPPRARTATPQPAPPHNQMHSTPKKTKIPHTKQGRGRHRQTVHLTLWVKPVVKAELERIAEQEGLSLSKTGSSFLEEAIRQKLHIQHAVLLQPIIETTIRQQMSKMMNRFVLVLARIAYEDGQTRRLVTNILSRQPGINAAQLDTILDRSSDEARKHIFRKTPQIHALIQAVETWLQEEDTT